jgi:hypothetical protein
MRVTANGANSFQSIVFLFVLGFGVRYSQLLLSALVLPGLRSLSAAFASATDRTVTVKDARNDLVCGTSDPVV